MTHVWDETATADGGTDYACVLCGMKLHRDPGLSDFAWALRKLVKCVDFISKKGMERNRAKRKDEEKGVHADILENCSDYLRNQNEEIYEHIEEVLDE